MIEFLYFSGCPNADKTLANLRAALQELNINEDILRIKEVNDVETAKNINFPGSPTILINGKDITTGEKPTEFHFACRVYEFNGKRTGIIPKDFIITKLQEGGFL